MRLVQVGGVNTSIPSPCRPAPRRWTSCEVVTNRVAGSLSGERVADDDIGDRRHRAGMEELATVQRRGRRTVIRRCGDV
jgi:hypothetical protein